MKAVLVGNNTEHGSSTMEILIALAILTMTMSAIILVVFSNQTLSVDIQIRQQAFARAEASITKARSSASQNFNSVVSSVSSDNMYTTHLDVTDLTPCRKHIIGRTSWMTDPLRPGSSELETDVTDVFGARALGGDCPTREPSGNWSSLVMAGSIPSGSGATAIDVRNGITFLAASGSFSVIDSRDRQHPTSTGTLTLRNNLNAIDAANQYVYGASNGSSGQLQIISVSNINHPTVVASASLPNVGGSHPEATAVFYYDSRVYLGTPRLTGTNAHELHVYDVSDPTRPSYISGVNGIEIDHNINAISVRNGLAYLGISTSQGAQKDLLVYSVADPNHVTLVSFLDLPGGGVRSLYLIGNRLYLGCFAFSGTSDLFVIDVSQPAALKVLGSVRVGADIIGITVSADKAFLATSDLKAEAQVWNISNPTHMTRIATYDGPKSATGLDYEDNAAWVGFGTGTPLRIIRSTP